jgi:hypothetical protein
MAGFALSTEAKMRLTIHLPRAHNDLRQAEWPTPDLNRTDSLLRVDWNVGPARLGASRFDPGVRV